MVTGLYISLFLSLSGCEKVPSSAPSVEVPENEKELHGKILSLAGEVGARDSKTGRITMIIMEGKQVEDKMLSELAGLKKLEILELRSTSVTKGGIAKLKKALPKLRVLNSKTGSRFLVNGKKQAGTTVKQKPRQ